MMYVLKVYKHPKGNKRGFEVRELSAEQYAAEVRAERSLNALSGCSSMSQHETREKAYEEARRHFSDAEFNKLF